MRLQKEDDGKEKEKKEKKIRIGGEVSWEKTREASLTAREDGKNNLM